jgi:predicted ABC-type ATPase
VRLGGHSVPEATVRRRYAAGLRNFFGLYQPFSTTWGMHDNSERSGMTLIAFGKGSKINRVENETIWEGILADYGRR